MNQQPPNELDRRLNEQPLRRVMRVWQLSRTELGALFGVSRQAASKWLDGGVPTDHAARFAEVSAITDLLTHYLQPDRIPTVVRRTAPKLGDVSLMDLVRSGSSDEALRLTRDMFRFADAHH